MARTRRRKGEVRLASKAAGLVEDRVAQLSGASIKRIYLRAVRAGGADRFKAALTRSIGVLL